jgi:hypothetical protein
MDRAYSARFDGITICSRSLDARFRGRDRNDGGELLA